MTHPEINISLENFPTFQVDENETPALASEHLEPFVMESLEAHADRLAELSQSIWENPELAFEEKHAVGLLTGYLEKEGYPVTCPYGGLETAFRAEFQTRGYNPSCHPTVA
jgi:metal-dependent amidase/aminoacylase/carboxypeptidase family protein